MLYLSIPPSRTRNAFKASLLPLSFMLLTACADSGSKPGDAQTLACDNGALASSSYCVSYIAGDAGAERVGKNQFILHVNRRDTGTPAIGLQIALSPLMQMSTGMQHATPDEDCTESSRTAGDYLCTVYYVMAASMNGVAMGDWSLTADFGGESVRFTPNVGMAMGDTPLATLKGQEDRIPGMPLPEPRTYYLFRESLSGVSGNHTLKLFIAARENMLSFPPVATGTVLNAGDADHELRITAMQVEVSTDALDWQPASEDGNGHWTAAAITGLSDAVSAPIHVRLRINGEQKTGNGLAVDGSANDYASFTVTPGGE